MEAVKDGASYALVPEDSYEAQRAREIAAREDEPRDRTVSFPEHILHQLKEQGEGASRPSSVASDAVLDLFSRRQPTATEELSRIDRVRMARAVADERSKNVASIKLPPLAAKYLDDLPAAKEKREEEARVAHRKKTVEAFNQWSVGINKHDGVERAARALLSVLHRRQPSRVEEVARLNRRREAERGRSVTVGEGAGVSREAEQEHAAAALSELLGKRQITRQEEEARIQRMVEAKRAANQRAKSVAHQRFPSVVLEALVKERAKTRDAEEERLTRLRTQREKGDQYMRDHAQSEASPALKELLEKRQQTKVEEVRRLERRRWARSHYTQVSTGKMLPDDPSEPPALSDSQTSQGSNAGSDSSAQPASPHTPRPPPAGTPRRGLGRLRPSAVVRKHLVDHARRVSEVELPTIPRPSEDANGTGSPKQGARTIQMLDKRKRQILHIRGPSAQLEETLADVNIVDIDDDSDRTRNLDAIPEGE